MIKIAKLVTGEELVADITTKGSTVKIAKPFILQMAPNNSPEGNGQMGLALFPYAPYVVDHTVVVDSSNIIWLAETPEGMQKDYSRALENLQVQARDIKEDIAKAISEAFPKK